MNKPEWWSICESPELRERFREVAKSFTKNPELREDLEQEAWLAVCEYLSGIVPVSAAYKSGAAPAVDEFVARDQKDLEFYEKIGYRAMNCYRMKEARHRELFKPWIGSASYQRVRRCVIKLKKRGSREKNRGLLLAEYYEGKCSPRAVSGALSVLT